MNDPMKFRKAAAEIATQIEITDKQIAAAEEIATEIDRDLPRLSLADEKAAKEKIAERNKARIQRDFRIHQRTGLLQQLEALRVPVIQEELAELRAKHDKAARDCEAAITAAGKAEDAFREARQVVANLRGAMNTFGERIGMLEYELQAAERAV